MSRWSLRVASRMLLALALLLLQQGALTHALSHPNEPAKPHSTHHCELCHAYAAADAEITPPALPALVATGDQHAAPEPSAPAPRPQRFVAFASRAPPQAS